MPEAAFHFVGSVEGYVLVPMLRDCNQRWDCYQKLVKIKLLNTNVTLRSRHSLFIWMHEGICSSKFHECWVQKMLLFLYYILYTYSLIFPEWTYIWWSFPPNFQDIFPPHYAYVLLSWRSLLWSLVVGDPKVVLGCLVIWWKFGKTELFIFHSSSWLMFNVILQNKHCVVP